MAELTLDLLKTRHPALIHTGISRMHEPTLFKAAEILDALLAGQHIRLNHLWGYDPNPANKEHHSGRAIDFMVHKDKDAGDFISEYVIANEKRLGLIHVLWQQKIYRGPESTSSNPKGYWQPMALRANGDPTQNHMDHPHIWFADTDYNSRTVLQSEGC